MSVTRQKFAGSAVAVVAALMMLTGCGSDGGGSDGGGEKKLPETATGSLENIANEVGCKPDMQTDADTIRQAICKNTDGKFNGKFVLATFATDRGQREWLNGAKDYGGYYLVGRKWVAVGEQKTVTALRGRLGGTMEEGSDHMNGGH
ncbi:hypothetical protein [Streptomyces acidicola]|uniref:hypothetical protein n=1 Tax=Streptomyces acidicola TaxID=2596892 RepID=UPI00128BE551|nr:hypothetical protein [Streptomyces acidicola]